MRQNNQYFPQQRSVARRPFQQNPESYNYLYEESNGLNKTRFMAKEVAPCDLEIGPFVETSRGFEPNYERKYKQTPFFLTFDEDSLNNSSVLQLAANTSETVQMSNDREGILKLESLSKDNTSSDFLVKIYSTLHSYDLMNQPIHAQTIFGSDGKNLKLVRPLVLERLGNLRVTCTDLSGATNNVQLTFSGEKHYRDDQYFVFRSPLERWTYPYWYTTDNEVILPANTNEVTAYITIRNYPFFLDQVSNFSDGEYEFKLFYNSGQRQICNGFIPSNAIGNGEFQTHFKQDLVEEENLLKIVFRNKSGSLNRVFWTLTGYEWRGKVNN